VFRVASAGEPVADPAEIAAHECAGSADLAVRTDLSPWCVVQLTEFGPPPRKWPVADPDRLPATAQLGTLSRLTGRAYKTLSPFRRAEAS
jgi:isopentenyl-diphosphate delta-isomerase